MSKDLPVPLFNSERISSFTSLACKKVKHLKPESRTLLHLIYQYWEVSGRAVLPGKEPSVSRTLEITINSQMDSTSHTRFTSVYFSLESTYYWIWEKYWRSYYTLNEIFQSVLHPVVESNVFIRFHNEIIIIKVIPKFIVESQRTRILVSSQPIGVLWPCASY